MISFFFFNKLRYAFNPIIYIEYNANPILKEKKLSASMSLEKDSQTHPQYGPSFLHKDRLCFSGLAL